MTVTRLVTQERGALGQPVWTRGWTAAGWAARLCVGGLFLLAAGSKLYDLPRFAEEIRAYRIVPVVLTNGMAYILPWLELSAAALLLAGVWRGEARLILFVLTLIFTIAKVWAELKGLRIDCGCFGHLWPWLTEATRGPKGLLLNAALLGLLILDFLGESRVRPPAGRACA
jgi:uncharacterized membrane protein YphA (DoxX/SURF4 family)